MRNYQDPDPLHGHGKAMPKPKGPNPKLIGSRYGRTIPSHQYRAQITKCCVNGCRKSH